MNKSFTIFIFLISSVCYLSSALELDVNSNSRGTDEVFVDNVPVESTDSVQIQPIENIEDVETEQASLLDIDTQGHENESARKARQFYGGGYGRGFYGGGRGFYGGGRGFYGGGRGFYGGGGGGFYGRRYGNGFGGYGGGFRHYG